MTEKTLPTPEELRKRLRYDPETGKLYWLERKLHIERGDGSILVIDAPSGGMEVETRSDGRGYTLIVGEWPTMSVHRVAWAVAHGEWPPHMVDHINGIRDDNRLVNLRSVTAKENARNRARRSDNTSGRTGVQKRTSKWEARIVVNGRYVHLGTFERFEDALEAREAAEIEHGFHPNHDRLW